MNYCKFIKILVLFVFCSEIYGQKSYDWELSPEDLFSKKIKETLNKKFPKIQTSDDVIALLKTIAKIQPLLNLQISKLDQKLIISGAKSKSISEIDITITSSEHRNDLRLITSKYLGKADSEEILTKILSEISDYLTSKGFFKSSISVDYSENLSSVKFNIVIDEDLPCHISKISDFVGLPSNLRTNISVGDICDQHTISLMEETVTNQLLERGYNYGTEIKVSNIYDSITNTMQIDIGGNLGKQITYELILPKSKFWPKELESPLGVLASIDQIPMEVSSIFKKNGYHDVTISNIDIKKVNSKREHHKITVLPGIRYFIASVRLEGNTFFTDKEILEETDFYSGVQLDAPPLDEESIQENLEVIKAKYYKMGFWSANIEFPRINKNYNTGQCNLVFYIKEGERRVFDGVLINGNKKIPTDQLIKLLYYKKGDSLTWNSLKEFEQEIKKTYINAGFINVDLKISLLQKTQYKIIYTKIQVDIIENKRMKFGEVSIIGLVRTKDFVVKREIRFKEGQWYDPSKIEETRLSLLNIGLFRSVNIVRSDESYELFSENKINHVIELQESEPGRISFGPGLSVYDGFRYSIESSYLNLGGIGRQVFAKAGLSEEKRQETTNNKMRIGHTFTLGFTEPYLLDYPIDGNISLRNKSFDNNRLWQSNKEGVLSISHLARGVKEKIRFTLFYSNKLSEVLGSQDLSLFETDQVKTGSLGTRIEYDSRDSILWTTSGSNIHASYSFADFSLGGDIKYNQWKIGLNKYFEIKKRWVFAVGGNFITYDSIERNLGSKTSTILPVSERLHSGGAISNRGYLPEFLGPLLEKTSDGVTSTNTLGGSKRGIYKMELRYLLLHNLALAGFIDFNNSFFSEDEIRAFGQEIEDICTDRCMAVEENVYNGLEKILEDPSLIVKNNYSSYGLSLAWLSPIGVINIYYGLPLKDRVGNGVRRTKSTNNIYGKGIFNFNVGSDF